MYDVLRKWSGVCGSLANLLLILMLVGCGAPRHGLPDIYPDGSYSDPDRGVSGKAPPDALAEVCTTKTSSRYQMPIPGNIIRYCTSAIDSYVNSGNYEKAFTLYFLRCDTQTPATDRTCNHLYFPMPDNFTDTKLNELKMVEPAGPIPPIEQLAFLLFGDTILLKHVPDPWGQRLLALAKNACTGRNDDTYLALSQVIDADGNHSDELPGDACNVLAVRAYLVGDQDSARQFLVQGCSMRPDTHPGFGNCSFAQQFGANIDMAERQQEENRQTAASSARIDAENAADERYNESQSAELAAANAQAEEDSRNRAAEIATTQAEVAQQMAGTAQAMQSLNTGQQRLTALVEQKKAAEAAATVPSQNASVAATTQGSNGPQFVVTPYQPQLPPPNDPLSAQPCSTAVPLPAPGQPPPQWVRLPDGSCVNEAAGQAAPGNTGAGQQVGSNAGSGQQIGSNQGGSSPGTNTGSNSTQHANYTNCIAAGAPSAVGGTLTLRNSCSVPLNVYACNTAVNNCGTLVIGPGQTQNTALPPGTYQTAACAIGDEIVPAGWGGGPYECQAE